MGNLFGFVNYDRPGPGVPKEEPKKPKLVQFFQIYFRKFWDLVKLNLMFVFFNIPALLLIWFLFGLSYGTIENMFASTLASFQVENVPMFCLEVFIAFSMIFVAVPVITTGPVQAGFTFVLRNFSRQEHAFILSDFKEHTVKNFKQALFISMIDFFVVLFLLIDIYICLNSGMNSTLTTFLVYVISLMLVLFLMMHIYIYPMLVTFELSLKHIYKNALIFAIVKLFPNLGILLICFMLVALPFLLYLPVAVVLFVTIMLSTVGLITNFYAYPILEKYMINKAS